MRYEVEMTDLFAGEANYSWVKRRSFDAPDDATNRQLINRAKKALEVDLPARTEWDSGDCLAIRFQGWLAIAFITPAV